MNGHTTCVDAVHFYLANIEKHRALNAFVEVYAEEALETARRLDDARPASGPLPPLYGVVAGLKDVICHQGHPVTAASALLQGFRSSFHATAVQKLIDAGAIIIGRQNCDEFAMGSSNEHSVYGPARHPADPDLVPGGSSGGSAVAVKAGLCMISLGSDTGGSVRQPADFCGTFGFKPSYGTISRHGLIAYASSFDQIGLFANSVSDLRTVLLQVAGADAYDATATGLTAPEQPYTGKLAYFRQAIENPGLDPEIRLAFEQTVATLRSQGYTVEPVEFDWLDYLVPTYYILTTAEASSNLSRYDGVRYGRSHLQPGDSLDELYRKNRSLGFGNEVKRRIMLGSFVLSAGYYDAYFTRAQQVRALITRQNEELFRSYDFLLSPTVPAPAFERGAHTDPVAVYLGDIYTVYANLTGIPAISLPLYRHSSGRPFGLQVMASRGNDLSLLRFSEELAGRTVAQEEQF